MASTNAKRVREKLLTGVDSNDLPTSFFSLILDLLAAKGTDGGGANPYRDVVLQLQAVQSSNNANAAIAYVRAALNADIDKGA